MTYRSISEPFLSLPLCETGRLKGLARSNCPSPRSDKTMRSTFSRGQAFVLENRVLCGVSKWLPLSPKHEPVEVPTEWGGFPKTGPSGVPSQWTLSFQQLGRYGLSVPTSVLAPAVPLFPVSYTSLHLPVSPVIRVMVCSVTSTLQSKKVVYFQFVQLFSCYKEGSDDFHALYMWKPKLEVLTSCILMFSYFMIVLEGLVPFSFLGDGDTARAWACHNAAASPLPLGPAWPGQTDHSPWFG